MNVYCKFHVIFQFPTLSDCRFDKIKLCNFIKLITHQNGIFGVKDATEPHEFNNLLVFFFVNP